MEGVHPEDAEPDPEAVAVAASAQEAGLSPKGQRPDSWGMLSASSTTATTGAGGVRGHHKPEDAMMEKGDCSHTCATLRLQPASGA